MSQPSAHSPDIFDRLFWRFAASLQASTSRPRRTAIVSIGAVVIATLILAASPRILIGDYTYDSFIPMDGALRMLNGQWPHLDFYTPIGDLYYILLGFCARVFGFSPKVVLWEQIIVAPVAALALWYATRDRLPDSLRIFLIIMIGLICVSPSDLDDASSISFLASYNRHGWVLITPVLVCCLLEPLPGRHKGWIGDALLLAAFSLMLVYLKVTFALVALGTIALAAVLVPRNRRSCLMALAIIGVVIAIAFASGSLMPAYLADLHRASLAAPITGENYDPFRLDKLKADLTLESFALLAPICFAVWLGRSAHTDIERNTGNRVLLLCMIVTGGSIALAWQNHEHAMPSQIVAMAVVFAAMWSRQVRREQDVPLGERTSSYGWTPIILAGMIFAFLAVTSIFSSGRAILTHTFRTVFNLDQPAAILSPYLQGLTLPKDTMPGVIGDVLTGKIDPALYSDRAHESWHNDVSAVLDNGWQLFQDHKPENPRIVTIFSAPLMTVATGTVPPLHMAAWMDIERTFGPRSPIVPEHDFSDTNVVMVFKLYNHDKLFEMVHGYLEANFHIAGETPIWQMWVRNGH